MAFAQRTRRAGLWGLLILWLLSGPWAVAAEPAGAPAAPLTIRIGIQPYADDGLLKGAEQERYRQLCEEIAVNAETSTTSPFASEWPSARTPTSTTGASMT